jgi:hypothetical protein
MPTKDKASRDPAPPSVTVRHYCQGIGDCHLLRFTNADGTTFSMLIDCGVHSAVTGGPAKIKSIVADIADALKPGKTIDVLVVTHEHWDHLSGFLTAADGFAALTIGEVWMGWTEDPDDKQAQQLDKFKGQALDVLQEASRRLDGMRGLSPHLSNVQAGLQHVLGFNFGAQGERVRSARNAASALNTKGVRYLEPGADTLTLPGIDGMRVYVLGPPRNAALLGLTDRASEMYGLGGGGGWALATALSAGFALTAGWVDPASDRASPFDIQVGAPLDAMIAVGGAGSDGLAAFVHTHYAGPLAPPVPKRSSRKPPTPDPNLMDQSWRRIDADWLGLSADLAMQLDNRTNNTSLALAFEFAGSRRVLLFAADAQIGSWLSWQDLIWGKGEDAVTGPDLLARTVYYKVGHHGSQNATAKAKGLELMHSPDLAAFIPTNEADAKKVGWGEMPFQKIIADLASRARGRVIRADDPWVHTDTLDPRFAAPTGSLRLTQHKKGLWVEVQVV